jgi:hypothetical protein
VLLLRQGGEERPEDGEVVTSCGKCGGPVRSYLLGFCEECEFTRSSVLTVDEMSEVDEMIWRLCDLVVVGAVSSRQMIQLPEYRLLYRLFWRLA